MTSAALIDASIKDKPIKCFYIPLVLDETESRDLEVAERTAGKGICVYCLDGGRTLWFSIAQVKQLVGKGHSIFKREIDLKYEMDPSFKDLAPFRVNDSTGCSFTWVRQEDIMNHTVVHFTTQINDITRVARIFPLQLLTREYERFHKHKPSSCKNCYIPKVISVIWRSIDIHFRGHGFPLGIGALPRVIPLIRNQVLHQFGNLPVITPLSSSSSSSSSSTSLVTLVTPVVPPLESSNKKNDVIDLTGTTDNSNNNDGDDNDIPPLIRPQPSIVFKPMPPTLPPLSSSPSSSPSLFASSSSFSSSSSATSTNNNMPPPAPRIPKQSHPNIVNSSNKNVPCPIIPYESSNNNNNNNNGSSSLSSCPPSIVPVPITVPIPESPSSLSQRLVYRPPPPIPLITLNAQQQLEAKSIESMSIKSLFTWDACTCSSCRPSLSSSLLLPSSSLSSSSSSSSFPSSSSSMTSNSRVKRFRT